MQHFAETCEAIAATTKKTEKVRILSEYFHTQPLDRAAIAAVFFSGRPFPSWEPTTLNVGGSLLWQVLRELTGKPEVALTAAYRRHGDLGSAAYDLLLPVAPKSSTLDLAQVAAALRSIAEARGPAAKARLAYELLARATALEAKYLIKIMTGEMRIGLKESLVEEAIAKAYGDPPAQVQRANMLLGDIGETLRLAAEHRLTDARMRLFHPLGFMLASPAENAEEGFAYFQQAQVEDKYDGIRAQAHCTAKKARLFSRTLDDISESFPELLEPLRNFAEPVILDGEILAWQHGRALPFSELQKRLGRKKVSEQLMRSVPVAYVVFDVLYAGNALLIDLPLRERGAILDRIFAGARSLRSARIRDPQGTLVFEPEIVSEEPEESAAQVIRAPVLRATSPAELDEFFTAAQARGNEGLMIKDVESAYAPGRRGRSWLKLKRELATLDVVVTAVEFGHGKRAGVLSDYTFAVRNGEQLVNVGKAYSGLTDAEIAELTDWFLRHTVVEQGFRREVEPSIVLEVAFNAVMQSDRHDSGYALRFPRILRIRWDKRPGEIDTLARVQEIFERQKLSYPKAM